MQLKEVKIVPFNTSLGTFKAMWIGKIHIGNVSPNLFKKQSELPYQFTWMIKLESGSKNWPMPKIYGNSEVEVIDEAFEKFRIFIQESLM